MSEIKTGGPAFPEIITEINYSNDRQEYLTMIKSVGGMTLRDYFAGKALQGLTSLDYGGHNLESMHDESAKYAYGYADAMLKAREATT